MATEPQDEALEVAPGTSVAIQFNRFLSPGSVSRQAICVTSEARTADAGPEGCAFGEASYDPVDRVARWHLRGLLPGVRYTVTLFGVEERSQAVRTFDDVPLRKSYHFHFTTSATEVEVPEPQRGVSYCNDIHGVIQGCAGQETCHRESSTRFGGAPNGGRFVSSDSALTDYVDHQTVAYGSATGGNPALPVRGFFGENMPYVLPTDPASSYVVYKVILGLSGLDTWEGAPEPEPSGQVADVQPLLARARLKPPAPGEYERIAHRISGGPMPPALTPVDGGSQAVEAINRWRTARALSAWISGGAEVQSCP